MRVDLLQQLQGLQGAPSVQMQEVPPEFVVNHGDPDGSNDGGGQDDIRVKGPGKTSDGTGEKRSHPAEFYEDEEMKE